jgi:transposase
MIPEAREVHLSRKDRKVLEARCRSPVTLQRDLKRARIVLLAAAGRSTRSIASEVGVQPRIVSLWRHRYADHGLEGLQDKPRPGKQPIYTKATDKRILRLLDKPPPEGFARWTGPLLAGALGDVDVQYVWRFLRSHKIDLAARKSWCESNDPNFTAKAADVVGLYVAPPEKAIVLCVDEKPSIQALERAQGYLKLPNGRALTGQSHDYRRHGTTTLFAALEVATGKIIATHSKRRRASSGEMGEPCGMPRRLSRASVVRVFRARSSVSSTGHSSHILTRCSTRRSTIRRATDFRSSAWGMLPK